MLSSIVNPKKIRQSSQSYPVSLPPGASTSRQARDMKDTPILFVHGLFPNPELQKILIGDQADASVRHLGRHIGFFNKLFLAKLQKSFDQNLKYCIFNNSVMCLFSFSNDFVR